MSEINVTPFVDVMLVLLIVFMVTAPLLTVGIPVDLPKVKADALTDQKDPIEITVKLDGLIYLGDFHFDFDSLKTLPSLYLFRKMVILNLDIVLKYQA